MWLVLEAGPDTATPGTGTLYYNTGSNDATAPSTVTASGTFRTSGNAIHDDLITAYFRNNQIDTTGYIDDIYIDTSGINLMNPIPEPGTLLLAAGGLLGLALYRNRRAS